MSTPTRTGIVPPTRSHALVVLLLGVVGLSVSASTLRDGVAILPVVALALSVAVVGLGAYGLVRARRAG
jgi:hypothetical protein